MWEQKGNTLREYRKHKGCRAVPGLFNIKSWGKCEHGVWTDGKVRRGNGRRGRCLWADWQVTVTCGEMQPGRSSWGLKSFYELECHIWASHGPVIIKALSKNLLHAHARPQGHTHTHTPQSGTENLIYQTHRSQSAGTIMQAWVETQDPTSGPTWRALLYHKSLGGALTDIHTVVRAKKACLSPALTLLSFRREEGGKEK